MAVRCRAGKAATPVVVTRSARGARPNNTTRGQASSRSAAGLGARRRRTQQRVAVPGSSRAVGARRFAGGFGRQHSKQQRRTGGGGRRLLVVVAAVAPPREDGGSSSVSPSSQSLPEHPDLHRGQLGNGLRYVVLPNQVPPHRFEAHLEMHVGSVDENEREQGLAHLVEHVTFLGSRKRESLLGTGTRSNAYTDFHHTVFHVHAPNVNSLTGRPMLPQVLDALREIAFEPELLPSRLEKERRAILAEMQMMNTIDYRVDVQLLTYLHQENALGCRFPIGLEEQIKRWTREELVGFHGKWYFPANATLYVVGDFANVDDVERLIEKTFGDIAPKVDPSGSPLERHAVRPPVKHVYGNMVPGARAYVGGAGNGDVGAIAAEASEAFPASAPGLDETVTPSIFRHPLLHEFSVNIFCKLPVMRVTSLDDLKRSFIGRLVLSVLKFRLNSHFASEEELKITSFDLDFSDSGREGCTVTTLTVTAEPKNWREAVSIAVTEVRRMKVFGVTKSEFKHYAAALLRDSKQLAEQAGTVPSIDNLDFVMESDALGHTVMDQRQSHEALERIVPEVTLEEVNEYARSILSYIADFGDEASMLTSASDGGASATSSAAAGEEEEGRYAEDMGPTKATSVVTCIPAFVDKHGESLAASGGQQRGGNLGTVDHDTLAALVESGEELEQTDLADDFAPPEDAVEFNLSAGEIARAIADRTAPLEPVKDFEVPDSLIDDARLEALVASQAPSFVPLAGEAAVRDAPDDVTGIVQKRLSNGVCVNYIRTDNEPQAAMIRVVAAGGRAAERLASSDGDGLGAIALATRALSEVGAIGPWERQQIELFCVSNLIHFVLETTEEFVVLDFHFASSEGGLRAVLEMIHLLLQEPRWEETSLVRAKQAYRAHYASLGKSLERATHSRALEGALGLNSSQGAAGDDGANARADEGGGGGGGCCFLDPNPEQLDAVTLEGAADALMRQFTSNNLEVNCVGDFDPEELEQGVLQLLGTLPEARGKEGEEGKGAVRGWSDHEVTFVRGAGENRQQFMLPDSDERACACIVGAAPYRWEMPTGPSSAGEEAGAAGAAGLRSHPLYMSVALSITAEVINSRLFTTVRDSLGLTYDVSFELQLYDRLRTCSWWSVSVTSTPAKISDALEVSLAVVRELSTRRVSVQEVDRARRTLMARHETDLKDNSYWIGLLTHLQCDDVERKDLSCLRDLAAVYAQVTVEDVYEAYNRLEVADVSTCLGVSGVKPQDMGNLMNLNNLMSAFKMLGGKRK